MRNSLVVAEVAVALVLVNRSGLAGEKFCFRDCAWTLASRRIACSRFRFSCRQYQKTEQITGFFDQSLEKIKAVPGVQSAAVVASPPFINLEQDAPFTILGQPAPPKGSEPSAFYTEVSPDYLDALSVPLQGGRFFTKFDTKDSRLVVVINQTMARRYFPNEDPVGKQLTLVFDQPGNPANRRRHR